MEIIILGCGVIGLTTAVQLSEKGYPVTIRTWKRPPFTTSDKAAAFWSPYRIGEDERTFEWIRETYRALESISRTTGSGVSMIRLDKYLKDPEDHSDAWWLNAIPEHQYTALNSTDLPPGYRSGWRASVPLMETPLYLPYLLDRFERAGGTVIAGEEIKDVRTYLSADRWVVNCTGLGSRALMKDDSVIPVRGQIAVLRAPGVHSIMVDADQPIYLVPRTDGCIIGGTYEREKWEEEPEPAAIDAILERAGQLWAGLDTRSLLRSYAGLRPYRPTVRLEADPDYPGLLHNYGHGGAGFTLSWGAADSISRMII
jgi:D-amino-acid oxidase